MENLSWRMMSVDAPGNDTSTHQHHESAFVTSPVKLLSIDTVPSGTETLESSYERDGASPPSSTRSRGLSNPQEFLSSLSSNSKSPRAGYRVYERKGGEIGKGTLCMEYSDLGTGDFRSPSFIVASADGSTISPLRYLRYQIITGFIFIIKSNFVFV